MQTGFAGNTIDPTQENYRKVIANDYPTTIAQCRALQPPDTAQILTFWQPFFVLHKSSHLHKQPELPKAPVNTHSLADAMMGPRIQGPGKGPGRLTHFLRSQEAWGRQQTQTDLHVNVSQIQRLEHGRHRRRPCSGSVLKRNKTLLTTLTTEEIFRLFKGTGSL